MRNLSSLKYSELQKLAKKAGIKANIKRDKLLQVLLEFEEKENKDVAPAFSSPKVAVTKKASSPQSVRNSATPGRPSALTPVLNRGQKPLVQSPLVKRTHSPAVKLTPVQKTKASTPVSSKSSVGKVKVKPATPLSRTPVTLGSHGIKKTSTAKSATPTVESGSRKRKQASPETPRDGSGSAKKRRSTFDKVPTPELEKMKKKAEASTERRTSGRLQKSISPGVTDMLDAMKPEMDQTEMKQSLMSVLDKKVQAKSSATGGSNIPRFVAYLNKKTEQKKPVTPGNKDWTKIHKKAFEKFDSIDVYLAKKRRRADDLTASASKVKQVMQEVQTAAAALKAHKTPTTPSEIKAKKPRPSYPSKTTPFKPVLNVKNVNLNFGAAKTPLSVSRKSLKNLPRKSPRTATDSAVKFSKPTPVARKSTGSALTYPSKPTTTPFKFTATAVNTSVNQTLSSKKKFDLQASLARPITWKPHFGKLKPVEQSPQSFKRPAKSVTKSRDVRRVNQEKRRAEKKQKSQMARRGLDVS